MILVNHSLCKNLNLNAASDLYNWLKSEEAASHISAYKLQDQQVFYIP